MDAAERKEILSRYMDHQRRFDAVAAKRQNGNAEVIPFTGPLRELEQEPTMREIEVLQLICDGLVNREIGARLFLSEETVKSHVRHLLAKLFFFQAEDGIRDLYVTGVQTCALPISIVGVVGRLSQEKGVDLFLDD